MIAGEKTTEQKSLALTMLSKLQLKGGLLVTERQIKRNARVSTSKKRTGISRTF
jgi:hypothetical protein